MNGLRGDEIRDLETEDIPTTTDPAKYPGRQLAYRAFLTYAMTKAEHVAKVAAVPHASAPDEVWLANKGALAFHMDEALAEVTANMARGARTRSTGEEITDGDWIPNHNEQRSRRFLQVGERR